MRISRNLLRRRGGGLVDVAHLTGAHGAQRLEADVVVQFLQLHDHRLAFGGLVHAVLPEVDLQAFRQKDTVRHIAAEDERLAKVASRPQKIGQNNAPGRREPPRSISFDETSRMVSV